MSTASIWQNLKTARPSKKPTRFKRRFRSSAVFAAVLLVVVIPLHVETGSSAAAEEPTETVLATETETVLATETETVLATETETVLATETDTTDTEDTGTVEDYDSLDSESFALVAQTPNQIAVATTLDSLEHSGDSLALYNTVLALSSDDARQAYEQLSGQVYASFQGALVENTQSVGTAINNRIRAASEAVAAPSGPDLGCAEGKTSVTDGRFSAYEKKKAKNYDQKCFNVWLWSFGSWGERDGTDGSSDTGIATRGFLIGTDGMVTDSWRIGTFVGSSRSSFDTSSSDGDSNNYHLGTYAGAQWGSISFRTGINYTWHDIEATRTITALGQTLTGDYGAESLNLFGELGYRFDLGASSFEPFVNLAHVQLKTDGFSESGGTAALTVDGQTMNTTFTTIGLRASSGFVLGGARTTVRGMLGWRRAIGDTDTLSTSGFFGKYKFTVSGTPIDKNAALVEVGLDFTLTPQTTYGLAYTGEVGSGFYAHWVNAKLTAKF